MIIAPAPTGELPRGRLVRRRALGSEAIYELLGEAGGVVTARVVRAPGLRPGTQLRLMAAAARAMERVDVPVRAAARGRRRAPQARERASQS